MNSWANWYKKIKGYYYCILTKCFPKGEYQFILPPAMDESGNEIW